MVKILLQYICIVFTLIIVPGCCWGGCLEKCKPCQPNACKPCIPCDDSCVVKEPKKSNRSYQKNIEEQRNDRDEDEEIVELDEEFI